MHKINLKPKNNIQMPKKWNTMNPNYEQNLHLIKFKSQMNGMVCIALAFEIKLFSFSSKRPKKIWTSFYKCFEGCLNAT